MDKETARTFLHDLASPLTVSRLTLKKIEEAVSGSDLASEKLAYLSKRIEALDRALRQMMDLHAKFKSEIYAADTDGD